MLIVFFILIGSFVGTKQEIQTSKSGKLVSRVVQFRKTMDGKIEQITKRGNEFSNYGFSKQSSETTFVQIDDDADAIARYCSISGDGKYIFVNWMLNYERVSLYHSCLSPGIPPIWEQNASEEFQGQVGISSDGSIISAGELNKGYEWKKYSNTPLNVYELGSNNMRGAKTSRDNSKVLYLSYNSGKGKGKISVYDAESYALLWEYEFDRYPQGFDCTPHGDTVAVSTYDSVYVFTESGQLGHGLPLAGWQRPPAISANGKRVVTGDYDGYMRIYQWNGVEYTQIYSHRVPPSGGYISWVGCVDISDDGKLVLMGSDCYIGTDNYVACFEDEGLGFSLKWKSTSPYAGGILSCRLSSDGSIAIVGCAGDTIPSGDVVCVYNTSDSIPILNISNSQEPGSITWVDIDEAGEWACASGKAVNIQQWGKGGQVYAIHIGEKVLKDIASWEIISPPDTLQKGTDYIPKAKFMNVGSDTIDTFMVHFNIYDSLDALIYADSSEEYNLPPYWVREVTFGDWTCNAYGWYKRLVYVYTDGDQYVGNDTIILYSYCEPTGIEDRGIPLSFNLSVSPPTPDKKFLDVFYALPKKTDVIFRVYDVTGRTMKRVVRRAQRPGYYHLFLNTGKLSAGIYFINAECGKESQTVKFIIVK